MSDQTATNIQDRFFREALQAYIAEYTAYFRDRLAAVYVRGSVHRNEAVPGVSDLDLFPFVHDMPVEDDTKWRRQKRYDLEQKFPATDGFRRIHGVEELSAGKDADADDRTRSNALGFILAYDATLIWGEDLVAKITPAPPDRNWAQGYFQSPWDLTRYEAGLMNENPTDFALPQDGALKLRKLARLGILGGGNLLMALGKFKSFRGIEVLPALKKIYPSHVPFLEETEHLYIQLAEDADERISDYLPKLVEWMDWVGAQLK